MKELKVLKESKEMFVDVQEDNMKNFKVMFFGPADSVFHNGVFVFEFNVSDNYPFTVPKVNFLTGGIVKARLHPNLYENGKVCLSILNTWGTDEWSPLLTFEKVMVTIKGLLDNNPMAHEPPYQHHNPHYNVYSLYYSLKSIPDVYQFYKNQNHPFADLILTHTKEHSNEILKQLENLSIHHNKSYQTIHHSGLINLNTVKQRILEMLEI